MLIKIGNSYYNDDYLAKLFAIDDGRHVIQYYNCFNKVLTAEEYAEVAEKYKVILNGEYWLNTDKIERVFSDDERMVVEFKNGNPTDADNETVAEMVEKWYKVGDYYYNPKYIIRLTEGDGKYFVQFTNGQTKSISEEEYEAILAIPQGAVTEEKTVALNMADGNQVIEKSEDVDGMTKVTVEKPATLIPANIKSGVNIGGVEGDLAFLTETKTVALNMASGDQVVSKSSDKDGMTEVTVLKPETFMADNIKKDVDIGGVVGTYEVTLGTKTITQNGIYPASDDGLDGFSSVEVTVSGGSVDHGGKYLVQVIDYDGTVLKQDHLNTGATFELPDPPTHDVNNPAYGRLVFQEFVSPIAINNNQIVVGNTDVLIGIAYTTVSGLSEFDIELTPNQPSGKTSYFQISGEKDWGDGTIDSNNSHTYSDYGKYTIKMSIGQYSIGAQGIFGQTGSQTGDQTCVGAFLTGITGLMAAAFKYCYNLKYVSFSNTLSSIGDSVFQSCRNLRAITIPNLVTSIAMQNFSSCYSLSKIVLHNNLTAINNSMFSTNYVLESMVIPSSVASIGQSVFSNCYNLTKVDFSNHASIPVLSNVNAFNNYNKLLKIIVPDSLYSQWITESNWVTLANCIYKASEV